MTRQPDDSGDEEVRAYLTELTYGPLTRAADRIAELLQEAAETDPDTHSGRMKRMDTTTRQAVDAITAVLNEGQDIGEFLAHALCHVAAAEGGIHEVLRNRPGSWEAGHIERLMAGTVGEDGEGLDRYRD